MESDTPIPFGEIEELLRDFNEQFALVHAGIHALREPCSRALLSELALQCEALRRSKDVLLSSMPKSERLAARDDQLRRSKETLLSVLPRIGKLTSQIDELRESRHALIADQWEHQQRHTEAEHELASLQFQASFNESELEVLRNALNGEKQRCSSLEMRMERGCEAEAELRLAQSEVESLEQVAELHAQHSLKVHRLMCEDAQHRLFRGAASPASPKRPGARRSSALRAWQSSLENQSQALLERSWKLLSGADPLLDIAEHDTAEQPALLNSDTIENSTAASPEVKQYWIGN